MPRQKYSRGEMMMGRAGRRLGCNFMQGQWARHYQEGSPGQRPEDADRKGKGLEVRSGQRTGSSPAWRE